MFRQIYIVKELMKTDYNELPEDQKIMFQFKKPGFDKFVIFDLDETLIHVKRDKDDIGM